MLSAFFACRIMGTEIYGVATTNRATLANQNDL